MNRRALSRVIKSWVRRLVVNSRKTDIDVYITIALQHRESENDKHQITSVSILAHQKENWLQLFSPYGTKKAQKKGLNSPLAKAGWNGRQDQTLYQITTSVFTTTSQTGWQEARYL